MNKCIVCDESAPCQNDRYFVIPTMTVVPNCYSVCDLHRGFTLVFEDFYDENSKRHPIEYTKNIMLEKLAAHEYQSKDFKSVGEISAREVAKEIIEQRREALNNLADK